MRVLRPDSADRTASGQVGGRDQRDHWIVLRVELDEGDLHPVQALQQCRIVDQARGSLVITLVSATRMITGSHGRFATSKTLIRERADPLRAGMVEFDEPDAWRGNTVAWSCAAVILTVCAGPVCGMVSTGPAGVHP